MSLVYSTNMAPMDKRLSIALHAVGVYAFFLVFGIYAEKLAVTAYGGMRYNSALFPSMLQSLGGVIASRLAMRWSGVPTDIRSRALLRQYGLLAVLGLVSSQLGHISLSYLSYPTLVIAKSCKLIPIALMNFVIYRKILSRRKLFSLMLISISVLSFSLFGKRTPSASGSSILGLPVLAASLLVDGVANAVQDNVFERFKVSAFHMMYYISIFRLFMSFSGLILTDGLRYSVLFMSRTPRLALDLLLYSLLSVLGQAVVYSMVQSHGSLALTTVNLTRKMASILLSLLVFGHGFRGVQMLSILGVFVSIGLEMLEPRKAKKARE